MPWGSDTDPRLLDEVRSLARFPDENPNPVLRLAHDGGVLYGNQPSLALLATWGCTVGGRAPAHVRAEIDAATAAGATRELLERCGDVTFSLSVTPVRGADYVNVYGRDVSARLQAEAHTASLARFPDENPNPVLRVSRTGEVLYANRSSAALLEQLDALDGRPMPSEVRRVIATAFETAAPQELEVVCGADTLALNFVPIVEEGYANIYGANITRRATALLKARDEAREASRAKSAFLANMSHELRTPMNAIIGYSELLIEEAAELEPAEMVPDLEKIRAAGKHLLELINGILDLSKIEAGKMDLYLETIEVGSMLDEIATTVAPLVARNRNRLAVEAPDRALTMRADVVKVRQVLFNLLGNAAKFTEDGTITLSVAAEPRALLFSVRDTGIGMTAEQLQRVFSPFTQADGSTTRRYGGTGLGLTISKQFCEMMGGSIEAVSEPGAGTTFRVRLPRDVGAVRPEPDREPAEADADAAPGAGDARDVVLVVDDDPDVGATLRGTLARAGFRVVCASGGDDGLRLAKKLRPAAITLDVMMPGKDGWEVLTRLKADPETADIPVVLVTILDERALGFALGAAEYMIKPIDRQRLVRVIERLGRSAAAGLALVVEDDADTRELWRRSLRDAGWEVAEAENGEAALEQLERLQPSVLIVDLMMPVLDGFELIARVRADARWRELPIVVASAKELGAEDHARLSGQVGEVLRKGAFELSDLVAEVRRHARPGEPG